MFSRALLAVLLYAQVFAGVAGARVERFEQIVRRITHRSVKIRLQAAMLLWHLGDPRAVAPLIAALRDPHEAVRAAAAIALGRFGEPSSAPALLKALRDKSMWVRLEALRSLRPLLSEPTPELRAAARDEDPQVRAEARRLLVRLGVRLPPEPRVTVLVDRGYFADGDRPSARWKRSYCEWALQAGESAPRFGKRALHELGWMLGDQRAREEAAEAVNAVVDRGASARTAAASCCRRMGAHPSMAFFGCLRAAAR